MAAKIEPKKSWKTTWAGAAGAAGIILIAIASHFDDDPGTAAEWGKTLDALGILLSAIGIGTLGFNARDDDKTSEEVGAK